MSKPAKKLTPGICHICKCTYFTPCANGCAWMDRTETQCTACACTECGQVFESAREYRYDDMGDRVCRARKACAERVNDQKPAVKRKSA